MKNIIETAREDGRFTIFLAAVNRAGLETTLARQRPLTVFAPTDEAFGRLPKERLDDLMEEPARLAEVLKYHITTGRLLSRDFSGRFATETLHESEITIEASDGQVRVNGAEVTGADIECSNGVIHAIDRVLVPETTEAVAPRH
jgi:uncharacterized surface protein with fasciclin (FAS1) repeats